MSICLFHFQDVGFKKQTDFENFTNAKKFIVEDDVQSEISKLDLDNES